MEIQTIKQPIKNKNPANFYIFTGEEWKVQQIYIHKLAECKNLDVVYIDSITDIYSKLQGNSFLNKNFCYVVRDDKEITTNEQIQSRIKSNLLKDNILILQLSTVDKRLKFYKNMQDYITVFDPLPEHILIKYIQREIDLSENNCKKLIEICENNYGAILLEIDKIKRFCKDKMTSNNGFKKLLADGTINIPSYDAIFDFVDCVLKQQVNQSFDLLQQCYDVGENTLTLLSVLYTNTKQVLQVQSCQSKDIAKSTGLTSWQIQNAKEKCGNFTTDDLLYFLQLIRKVEKGIKIGTMEEQYAMNYVLVNMF